MKAKRRLLAIAALMLGGAGAANAIEPEVVMAELCTDCHGGGSPKGGVSLDDLDHSLAAGADLEKWTKVLDQLVLGEMPPADADGFAAGEREALIAWIRGEMLKAGHVPENKLGRPGYGNYVPHDVLFGDAPAPAAYSPPRIWRIRPAVYEERIKSLDKNAKFVRPFSLGGGGHGFKDYDNQFKLAGADLNQLMANAQLAARSLTQITEEKGEWRRGPRTPQEFFDVLDPDRDEPDEARLVAAIDWLFPRVLLRDPTDAEVARLVEFAEASMEADGRELGFQNLVSAILLNPESLYRSERGAGEPDEHGRVRLSDRELAYALAYSLTDSRPDAELLAADLGSREAVGEQVGRLLDDEKVAKPRLLGFFREYFDYGGAADVFKDAELFRSHSPEALVEDTDRLVMYLYERDRDVLKELLTTRLSFVQFTEDRGEPKRNQAKNHGAHLAYNLPPDWKWHAEQPLELPAGQRAGILTQPSWLVAKSGNFDNDAIRRGLWVRTKLLGGTIPDLPITVDAQLPEDPDKTLRERMGVTREDYCWKCHQRMNPLGEAFELYDHFGRWRTRELGEPVDSSGAISLSGDADIDGEVGDAVEMMLKLAESDRVRQVFVRHAFRYFMGRNETPADAATLRRADRDYVASGGSMKTLVRSLLTSDSLLYRKG